GCAGLAQTKVRARLISQGRAFCGTITNLTGDSLTVFVKLQCLTQSSQIKVGAGYTRQHNDLTSSIFQRAQDWQGDISPYHHIRPQAAPLLKRQHSLRVSDEHPVVPAVAGHPFPCSLDLRPLGIKPGPTVRMELAIVEIVASMALDCAAHRPFVSLN